MIQKSDIRNFIASNGFSKALFFKYWRYKTRQQASAAMDSADTGVLDFGVYPKSSLNEITSQLCTADQILSAKYDEWCEEICSPPKLSRKQWEYVYILEALKVNGMLCKGFKGLGFGCGREPIAGVLAKYGVKTLATDLRSERAQEQGWAKTLEHSATLEELYVTAAPFIPYKEFSKLVEFRNVDMNDIPVDLYGQYDFVWSACALEHLGSLRHGIEFILNSIKCLKVGGVAVHTTEFNLSSEDDTCEDPGCSIYRKKDIESLRVALEEAGCTLSPLNLHTGSLPVDRYIDVPPYKSVPHLKLKLSNYTTTSIGLLITRHSVL